MFGFLFSPNWKKFIFEGSPFVPPLSSDFLLQVKEQVIRDQAPPQLVIAKDLQMLGVAHGQMLMNDMNGLYQQFRTTGNDLYYFQLGLGAPLSLICVAFFIERDGPSVIDRYFDQIPAVDEESRKLKVHVRGQATYCHELLLKDTTCAYIFKHVIRHSFRPQQVYFRLGMEVAKLSFATCNIMFIRMMGWG